MCHGRSHCLDSALHPHIVGLLQILWRQKWVSSACREEPGLVHICSWSKQEVLTPGLQNAHLSNSFFENQMHCG